MKCARSVLAFVAAIAAIPSAAAPFTYTNERFGTVCTFPDDVFTDRQPEPDNGDGQQWLAPDGASLICSGILNIDNDTPRHFVATEKASTAVLSGLKAGNIFYERRLFGKDGVIRTVWIEYPPAVKPKYDPLVGAIAASLEGP
ncbi:MULTISPECIES: hypothetical protein [unclassified Mesorhizobium]|uniref:hypothetical protein n=1 Tax=unclassified Mesorhizobium TaxID=325217 RepID=UPI00112722F5|nr:MULTISPECIES: hypothetical protein [unclassified Mesorhizobium]MBZ9701005.1 hypothetical protein [Mesorhizobium sp. CO1-1-3]MBZ9946941.1 hypothetical protein [Mesorhizobium sp. BR1-1-11]TPJ04879.1 hypothetical protein FJ428_16405 [Mesorhizobium sp. B2-8-1]